MTIVISQQCVYYFGILYVLIFRNENQLLIACQQQIHSLLLRPLHQGHTLIIVNFIVLAFQFNLHFIILLPSRRARGMLDLNISYIKLLIKHVYSGQCTNHILIQLTFYPFTKEGKPLFRGEDLFKTNSGNMISINIS